ncbi:MAG: hypothetical protein H0W27_03540 [Actinobacteria bacterium]|nr:hypothetical protein [Actinomycetota bacterium]
MTASLDECWLKITRAESHFDIVKSAIHGFLQPNPERIAGQLDAESGEEVYYTRRYPGTRREWSIIIGDALQNWRNALDYIVCGLVRMNGEEPSSSNAFPIVDRESDYPAQSKQRIARVYPGSEAVVEGLQAFNRGNAPEDDPLCRLRDMNNWDKHKALHTTTHVVQLESAWPVRMSEDPSAGKFVSGAFERERPLARIPADRELGQAYAEMVFDATFDIAFEGGPPLTEGLEVIETLQQIGDFVRFETLPRFAQFFA